MFQKEDLIEIKKSKFFEFLLTDATEEKINKALNYLKKEHKKATHICYAYRLQNPFCEKAVDDGEPSGTGGRPILTVLQKSQSQNVCVFIVRYFGGVKLGAGGLIRAYTKATAQLLNNRGEK